MKKMLNYKVLFLFAIMVSFIACVDDDLDDLTQDPIERLIGQWSVNEKGTAPEPYTGLIYEVLIIENPQNSTEVLIQNFNHQGMAEEVNVLVAGSILTIPQQQICDNTVTVRGSGRYEGGRITLNYTTNDGAYEDEVSGVLSNRRPL